MAPEDSIDEVSPIPRYRQVAALIRARIESGELQPGQPIPSQNTLMQRYGVARMTAHKALGVLVDEGLVVVVPGVGALVARRKG
jgi:GntR family transcriptional regulator